MRKIFRNVTGRGGSKQEEKKLEEKHQDANSSSSTTASSSTATSTAASSTRSSFVGLPDKSNDNNYSPIKRNYGGGLVEEIIMQDESDLVEERSRRSYSSLKRFQIWEEEMDRLKQVRTDADGARRSSVGLDDINEIDHEVEIERLLSGSAKGNNMKTNRSSNSSSNSSSCSGTGDLNLNFLLTNNQTASQGLPSTEQHLLRASSSSSKPMVDDPLLQLANTLNGPLPDDEEADSPLTRMNRFSGSGAWGVGGEDKKPEKKYQETYHAAGGKRVSRKKKDGGYSRSKHHDASSIELSASEDLHTKNVELARSSLNKWGSLSHDYYPDGGMVPFVPTPTTFSSDIDAVISRMPTSLSSPFRKNLNRDNSFVALLEMVPKILLEFMGEKEMLTIDAVCRDLFLIQDDLGVWKRLGEHTYAGLELVGAGLGPFSNFSVGERVMGKTGPLCERPLVNFWRRRYIHFKLEVKQFRPPFGSAYNETHYTPPRNTDYEIRNVDQPDEVAYTKVKLRTDAMTRPVYMEVQVDANPDNLSLAIVDFDEGGKSSVTFSPDTGAVIKETKIQESPRKVKGSYFQPLDPKYRTFEGKMGIYVKDGKMAFFRKYEYTPEERKSEKVSEPWESTGFVIGLDWAQGAKLTPCLAFRDPGQYITKLAHFGCSDTPPFDPPVTNQAFDERTWHELNWEGANDQ